MTQQFDLFVANDATNQKAVGSPAKRRPPTALSEEDMVRVLRETGRYRILKNLEPRPVTTSPPPGFR